MEPARDYTHISPHICWSEQISPRSSDRRGVDLAPLHPKTNIRMTSCLSYSHGASILLLMSHIASRLIIFFYLFFLWSCHTLRLTSQTLGISSELSTALIRPLFVYICSEEKPSRNFASPWIPSLLAPNARESASPKNNGQLNPFQVKSLPMPLRL